MSAADDELLFQFDVEITIEVEAKSLEDVFEQQGRMELFQWDKRHSDVVEMMGELKVIPPVYWVCD